MRQAGASRRAASSVGNRRLSRSFALPGPYPNREPCLYRDILAQSLLMSRLWCKDAPVGIRLTVESPSLAMKTPRQRRNGLHGNNSMSPTKLRFKSLPLWRRGWIIPLLTRGAVTALAVQELGFSGMQPGSPRSRKSASGPRDSPCGAGACATQGGREYVCSKRKQSVSAEGEVVK